MQIGKTVGVGLEAAWPTLFGNVKELSLSDYIGATILFTLYIHICIYAHSDNLN